MVDRGGADELADEDEEDCVADPEARRDEGHCDHIEGDEQSAEVKLRRHPGRQPHVAERFRRGGARERDPQREAEEDHRGRHRAAEPRARSEEHTSELQSLMRISYAVFSLKKKTTTSSNTTY